ncbi:RluA family pseudouridine synthase [Geomonas sp. RF6]|uniref:pseudouridine synthase n=1 Tax=Geomonas sp. RF6 TaxID=2897342 RepID=UPI001E3541E8|nr:RluA family pseudouridine synthase [Geomonas sp. RF6]UFS69060.1 RluA family pseudouridine synthase [Geomonas sp. RF6]
MLTYQIETKDHFRRADSFLRNLLPKAPHSYLKKLLTAGHLKINGAPADAAYTVRSGDVVTLKESAKTAAFLATRTPPLEILFEDTWIVSFNKAPGLSVHRTEDSSEPNLVEAGERFLAERDGAPGKLRPVNRLDKGTSGAIIMAKNAVAAGMFGRMVKEEGLGKLYLALVEGSVKEEDVIDAPLDGKESQTRYLRLLQGEDVALLAVYPVTGRMHQIRQHFKLVKHPILGDKRYGGRALSGFTGHALHSLKTTLTHPATTEGLEILAPLPAALVTLCCELLPADPAHLMEALERVAPRATTPPSR